MALGRPGPRACELRAGTVTFRDLHRVSRRITALILLVFAVLLCSPALVLAAVPSRDADSRVHPAHASAVSLRVSAGFGGVYRDTVWTPIRVVLHNSSSADIQGMLDIPQSSEVPSIGASPAFHGLYRSPVFLPAGETKHLTIYVPGSGVQGQVVARFLRAGRVLAAATSYVIGINSTGLLIGVMSGIPDGGAWVRASVQHSITSRVVALTPATFDPVPDALAAFNMIVLTNIDTSQFDSAQLTALQRFVHDGGSLLLVGGPSAQATLDPLPQALLPGRLTGVRALSALQGLGVLGALPRSIPNGPTAVSVLAHPRGIVLASEAGVPLVVRLLAGKGAIEYTAFDPALSPARAWTGTHGPLARIIASTAPLAISRTLSQQGFRARFTRAVSSQAITGELSNLPAMTFPLLSVFALLTLLYVVILGPANFLVLHWLGRSSLSWITLPVLALSYVGLVFGLTGHIKDRSAMLNSVGLIALDGGPGPHSATLYVGFTAPLSGDYNLTYGAPALVGTIAPLNNLDRFSFRSASTLNNGPLGVRLQEGAQTNAIFPAMKQWSTRDVIVNTHVSIPGTVRTALTPDRSGTLVGSIHNGTNLDVLSPIIVAGQTIKTLPNLPPGATIHVRVRPTSEANFGQTSVWTALLGRANSSDDGGFGGFGGFGDCCNQSVLPSEGTLSARIRNVASMLSQVEPLTGPNEVELLGWSLRPVGSFTVNGSVPQRRDLNLLAVPVSVHLPSHGTFQLLAGTLGAQPVDINPKIPQSDCCSFFSRNDHEISIGAGGSITFQFNIPNSRHVRFHQLQVTTSAGDNGIDQGQVYDWRTHRWAPIDLSTGTARIVHPDRITSPGGAVLLRLLASPTAGDLSIDNPYGDMQISGTGAVT